MSNTAEEALPSVPFALFGAASPDLALPAPSVAGILDYCRSWHRQMRLEVIKELQRRATLELTNVAFSVLSMLGLPFKKREIRLTVAHSV